MRLYFVSILATWACAGLLAFAGLPASAAKPSTSDPGDMPATVLDIGLQQLSNRLFQIGMVQHEVYGSRTLYETRFIPNRIDIYRRKNGRDGRDIMIVVAYRHREPDLGQAGAEARCRALINWVRFNLGVKDKGSLIGHASDYDSSTLYQYIPLSRELTASEESDWAQSLDRRTLVTAQVSPMGTEGEGSAFCQQPLVITPKATFDFNMPEPSLGE